MSRSDYKGENNSGDLRYEYGLLAQEVDQLLNETDPDNSIIKKDDDGLLGMDYKQLLMPLIKSVQELSGEIERLKKEILEKTIFFTEYRIKKELKKTHNSKFIEESLKKLSKSVS